MEGHSKGFREGKEENDTIGKEISESKSVINNLTFRGHETTANNTNLFSLARTSNENITENTTICSDDTTAASAALSLRLATFRKWLTEEAGVEVHPAICIVNKEATDGTKDALYVVQDKQQQNSSSTTPTPPKCEEVSNYSSKEGRVGRAGVNEDPLYNCTVGCQVLAVSNIQKGETIMKVPRSAMITPDLVASSDAGRALLACCKAPSEENQDQKGFWDAFENTTNCESIFAKELSKCSGPQLLAKILLEREKAESCMQELFDSDSLEVSSKPVSLVDIGTISTRAPLLALLIQQRFSSSSTPPAVSEVDVFDASSTVGTHFSRLHESALPVMKHINKPPGSPATFAPYARTLPSFVSIPLCWSKSELALLASSIPGFALLQDIAATTCQLAYEYIALVKAGVHKRFPKIFSEGTFTWDRWVWAAAVVSSRVLPVTCYIDKGLENAADFKPKDTAIFQSPAEIWNELGVMVPLLDLLNHEIEVHQVTWQPCVPNSNVHEGDVVSKLSAHYKEGKLSNKHSPQAIVHRDVTKGSELFCCYATKSNQILILQYGFAQIGNSADEVRIGWGLADAVGHLEPPTNYFSMKGDESVRKFLIFEANRQEDIDKWWTPDRMTLLKKEAFLESEAEFMKKLEGGKKFTALAYADGNYHPILLAAFVVATMPKIELQKHVQSQKQSVTLSKRHIQVLRSYLVYFFSRKLEKLLQNIDAGLKEQLPAQKLWTSASQGGLNYNGLDESFIGWHYFFETRTFHSVMKVKQHSYALGTESCIFALYDGQLRSLQLSLNNVCDDGKFTTGIMRQLNDLGFVVAEENEGIKCENSLPVSDKKDFNNKKCSKLESTTLGIPDIKLHIGNLSSMTTSSDIHAYFSTFCGKDEILNCHVPEQNGHSRGFGFVTLPGLVANHILKLGKRHEIRGRLVVVSRSNSTGTKKSSRTGFDITSRNDRCSNCGYRPKYCTCARSNIFENGHCVRRDASPRRDIVEFQHRHDFGQNKDLHAWNNPCEHYNYPATRSRNCIQNDDRFNRQAQERSVSSKNCMSSCRMSSYHLRGSPHAERPLDECKKRSLSSSRDMSRSKKNKSIRRSRSRS